MATMNQAPQQGAQQGIEQQVAQLVQAAVQGDQKATQQIEQIMQAAQQGNQEAIQIAQIIQKVIQAMQAKQGVKAQLGTKLDYINKLKGNCPDGQETYYFKDGGQVKKGCKPCMEKAKEGKKLDKKMNEIQKFKAQKGADSKKFINPNDTVNTKFGPRDLNGNTKFPRYDASKENYDTATRIRVHEKDGATENEGRYWSAGKKEAQKSKTEKTEKTEKKLCGGKAKKKAKKHLLGGPAEVMNQPLDLKTKLAPSTQFEFRITDPKKMMQWSKDNRWNYINDATNQEMHQKGLTRKVFPTDYQELDDIIKRGLESVEFHMDTKEARKNPKAFVEDTIRSHAGGSTYADMAIKRFNTPGYQSTYDGQRYYTKQGQPIKGSEEDVARMASNGRYIYDRKGQRLGF